MYDRICSDLRSPDPLFVQLLDLCPDLEMFPPLGDLPYSRYLLVSKNQQSIARAKQMGIGSASPNPELKADILIKSSSDLRPHLSFINAPVEGCDLFIFDMGNVVVKNIHMLGKISRRLGLDREEFKADYHKYDFALMDGTLPIEAYWEHVRTKFGVKVEGNPFAKDFSPRFNDEVVDLIKRLRSEGKRVVCGSNTFARTGTSWRGWEPWHYLTRPTLPMRWASLSLQDSFLSISCPRRMQRQTGHTS